MLLALDDFCRPAKLFPHLNVLQFERSNRSGKRFGADVGFGGNVQLSNYCVSLAFIGSMMGSFRLQLLGLMRRWREVELRQSLAHERRFSHESIDEHRVTHSAQTSPDPHSGSRLERSPSDVRGTELALRAQLYRNLLRHSLELTHLNRAVREPALAELQSVALVIEEAEQGVHQKRESLVIGLLEHLGVYLHACALLELLKVNLEQLEVVEQVTYLVFYHHLG